MPLNSFDLCIEIVRYKISYFIRCIKLEQTEIFLCLQTPITFWLPTASYSISHFLYTPHYHHDCFNIKLFQFLLSGLTNALSVCYSSKLKRLLSDIGPFTQPNTISYARYVTNVSFIKIDYENILRYTQCDDIRVPIVHNIFQTPVVSDLILESIPGSNHIPVEYATWHLYGAILFSFFFFSCLIDNKIQFFKVNTSSASVHRRTHLVGNVFQCEKCFSEFKHFRSFTIHKEACFLPPEQLTNTNTK